MAAKDKIKFKSFLLTVTVGSYGSSVICCRIHENAPASSVPSQDEDARKHMHVHGADKNILGLFAKLSSGYCQHVFISP